MAHATREAWLGAAVDAMRPWYADLGQPIPPLVRCSCGWPSRKGTAQKNRRIGECWDGACSADGASEIFVSPSLGTAIAALDVLAHELVHAAVGCKCGHKGAFKQTATKLGLTGKMTATVAGPELLARLNVLAADLGPYPHAALTPGVGRKVQGTRLLKCECATCGYTVRVTRTWLDHGAPLCPTEGCEMGPLLEAV